MISHDPIADLLTIIRNATDRLVVCKHSTFKASICQFLKDNGYIESFSTEHSGKRKFLAITLKYYQSKKCIERIQRVSKPSCRVYANASSIPKYFSGLGVYCVSTNQGMMTDKEARTNNLGGELIFTVC